MLTFTKNRTVFWHDTMAGTIEPVITGAGKWAYIPGIDTWDVPNILRRRVDFRTQREIKSYLRRKLRLINTT